MSEPKWRIRDWFKEYDERTYERLRIYHSELIRWTKAINLISSSNVEEADRLHFADSILGVKLILPHIENEEELWDIGSGNGFPGVIFSILRPELTVLCLDSDERKVAFLKQLSHRLELPNLAARCDRIEKVQTEAIACAVSRAFAPLIKSLTISSKAFCSSGKYFAFKGVDYKSEIDLARPSTSSTWNTEILDFYTLPIPPGANSSFRPEQRVIVKSTKL